MTTKSPAILPVEVLVEVAKYIHPGDVRNFAIVSKIFYAFCRDRLNQVDKFRMAVLRT